MDCVPPCSTHSHATKLHSALMSSPACADNPTSMLPHLDDEHGFPDINAQRYRPARRQPSETENLYQTIFHTAGIGIALVDLLGQPITANAALQGMLGYTEAELQTQPFTEFTFPEDVANDWTLFNELLDGTRESYQIEKRFIRKDGVMVWGRLTASLVQTPGATAPYCLAMVEDVTARHHAEAALTYQALHDSLTGLPNRVLLNTRLEHALCGSVGGEAGCALLLLDLDRFKEVNDTLGHAVGDRLLQDIGERLQCAVPAADVAARLGGDEFAVLLTDTNASGAAQVAEDLVRVLQAAFLLDGQPVQVDASIGIANAPEHGQDADTLLRCADVAMYQAKRSGTGVALYSAAADDNCPHRLALLGELRNAIKHEEMRLHYQPKLDLREGRLVGVEALVRWQHPERGFLPPSAFIPIAEQTGLIFPLTHWVLEAALKQQRVWRGRGIDVPVAVNLSRRTLQDPQLPDIVAELLHHLEVPASALVLEITESSLMADPLRAGDNLDQLRALGVHVSIDDFGTGYSSLASLKNLSVDELKIDRSFVQAMAADASARAIVRAIIDLADALSLRVVAEGVEDRATWDLLAQQGCEIAQGYFLSRPLDALELEDWIDRTGPGWLELAAEPRRNDPLQERIRGRGARLTAEEEFIARKQAEAALQASEERSRLALRAAGMGTWDWDAIQGSGFWSVEAEGLFGLQPGAFPGTLAAFKQAVHPDDWEAVASEMQTAQAEHRDSMTRFRALWPDGTVRWIENQGRAIYAAGDNDTLVRVTGTSLDITERMRSDEDRARLAAIVTSSTAAIYIRNVDGLITSWNASAERLYGYTPDEVIGTFAPGLAAPDRLDEVRTLLDRIVREERVEHFETVRIHKSGYPVDVAMSMSPIRDVTGRLVGAATIARDIGPRKQLERRLGEARDLADEASRVKSDFLASMSHEIGTPVNRVIGMTRLLLDTELDGQQRDYAEAVQRSGDTLLTLVDDILDFSRR